MKGNDFVQLVLRSPFYSVLGDTMLISVTGRKTGRNISLPVNFYRQGNTLWVISSRERSWWRNLLACPDVLLHLRGQDYVGSSQVILDEASVAAQLAEYVRRMPMSARALGVRMQGGTPDPEDLARLARQRLFVKICIEA
jgi:deazaflavin-dependent oxidoreductase (nitroreductase family)